MVSFFTLLFLLYVQILRYILGGILGVNVLPPLLISVLILLCIFVAMEHEDMKFSIGIRSRLDMGPCVGITYLGRHRDGDWADGDWNELCIELLILSIIIVW